MRGLTLQVHDPLPAGGNWREYLCEELTSYSHVIDLWGGFKSAQFTLRGNEQFVGDWLDVALARHIEVYSPGGSVVWDGFVDKVDGNTGPLSVTAGPVGEVGNRIAGTYVPMDTTLATPIYGITTPLTALNDTDSQALYGILYKIVNFGKTTAARAPDMQQKHLESSAWPKVSKDWSSDRASDSSVTVDLSGYFEYLAFPYEDLNTGTLGASTVITNVLAATPNAWLVFDTVGVNVNALLIPRKEIQLREGTSVIKDAVSVGSGPADYLPWSFGIYEGMTAVYRQVPTDLEDLFYIQRITEGVMQIETVWGAKVDPWDVRPGRWLLYADYQTGRSPIADLRRDTRTQFIDKVTFKAPLTLTLSGDVIATIEQVLAAAGLAGKV